MAHWTRCATQTLYSTDTSAMNKSLSWSLPSLSFLSADLTWLDMYITLSLLNPCLHRGETRHNLNNWCFWLLNILNLPIKWFEICLSSLKATTNGYKCLDVLNRVRLENFQKNGSEEQLVCRWTWSVNVTLGTFQAFLARSNKVIAIWLYAVKNKLWYSIFTKSQWSCQSFLRTVQMQPQVIHSP